MLIIIRIILLVINLSTMIKDSDNYEDDISQNRDNNNNNINNNNKNNNNK